MRFDSERQTKSINALKQISLELLELDERVLILGAIPQRALHHLEGSLKDVQRTYPSSESLRSMLRMLNSVQPNRDSVCSSPDQR